MYKRQRYLVWENVPGAFSSSEGEDFRAVIEEIIRIKYSTCNAVSYTHHWYVYKPTPRDMELLSEQISDYAELFMEQVMELKEADCPTMSM